MIDVSRIEVVEVVWVPARPVTKGNEAHARGPFWKATVAFRDALGPVLTGTWYIPATEFPDHAVIPVVRNYFHRICSDIAEETKDWLLEEAPFQQLKRPTAPSKAPPATAN